MKPLFQIQNLHLSISILIVISIALVYGFLPQKVLYNPFDFSVVSTDLANILKAVMGFYIASALLWIIGIFNPKFWNAATLSNIIFMLGLGFGRCLSCLLDGIPSALFVFGMVGELTLGFYGLRTYQIKNIKDQNNSNKLGL